MTIQKIIEYRPADSSGKSSDEKFRITLNILEDSSN